MYVIKRDGTEVIFDDSKIKNAIRKAEKATVEEKIKGSDFANILNEVSERAASLDRPINVEEIQKFVKDSLKKYGYFYIASNYGDYMYKRLLLRKENSIDKNILSITNGTHAELAKENSNKNMKIVSVMRDYWASEVSRDLACRTMFTPEMVQAHQNAEIWIHDLESVLAPVYNCALVDLEEMFYGTVINGTCIDRPKSFLTACTVASQISAGVSSSQYGGQTMTASHLAPFVDVSRQKYRKLVREELEITGISFTEEQINEIAEKRTRREISDGIQTFMYQVNSIMGSNGQSPFISLLLSINEVPEGQTRDDLALIIEEVLNQRILGMKNEVGAYVTVAFPKLLYMLDENNVYEGSKYFYLTELAAKCTSKRLVPDYISAKKMRELKGSEFPCMGCRSFLSPDTFTEQGIGNIAKHLNYVEGQKRYYGRFNQGVVTINLVDVALTANKDEEKFWEILDERLELCCEALMVKHNRLLGTKSDVAPILWQQGAIARLEKGEVIDPLLFNGYSTISLGYAGIHEMTVAMKGVPHTDPIGKEFALRVMRKMNDKCEEWKAKTSIGFSLYGTPIENTVYTFSKGLQKKFGKIPGVTDRNFITNSYHIHVTQEIDAFSKLSFEAQFQDLSQGGAITYVETHDLSNNIPAVVAIIQHIYENVMYAELNTKSDYCQVCNYDGEIEICQDEHNKLFWKCPKCGNTDESKLNVARRVCGYISTNFFNAGRTEEIRDRVCHI